jgi:hypothetical protein
MRHIPTWVILAGLFISCVAELHSFQIPLQGSRTGAPPRLLPDDEAIFQADESRQDLPCEVRPIDPVLGFDLRLRSGYEVTVPWDELSEGGDELRVLVRITGKQPDRAPYHLIQRIATPRTPANASGDLRFTGVFEVGEGTYRADWLMRGRQGRVCSHRWDFRAELPQDGRDIPGLLQSGTVMPASADLFAMEPPVVRSDSSHAVKLRIMVNVTPPETGAAAIRDEDLAAIVATLRAVSRNPMVREFSVAVFQLHDPRLLYEQESASQIDFVELGRALTAARAGTVSLATLTRKHANEEFLATLLKEQEQNDRPDAVVFVGPRLIALEDVSDDTLRASYRPDCPVFYLNHDFSPARTGWRDVIGRFVRILRGREYSYSRPLEMWSSVKDMLGHIKRYVSDGSPR